MKFSFLSLFFLITVTSFAQQLEWARSFGSGGSDRGFAIDADANGNVITAGCFSTALADLDPGEGVATFNSAGNWDIFIEKMDVDGNYLWAKQIGHIYDDVVHYLQVDDAGNIYLAGYYSGTVDFDPGAGQASLTSSGNRDAFVMKLDPDGNYLWAKSMGSTGLDQSNRIAIDADGNVFTCGVFEQTVDFDPGSGVSNLTNSTGGFYVSFLQKLDTNGEFQWVVAFASTMYDALINGLCTDESGDIYASGHYYGELDADPGEGAAMLPLAGGTDAFVIKLSGDDASYIWSASFGGVDNDTAYGITASNGVVYITGAFRETMTLLTAGGEVTLTSNGYNDIYTMKMEGAGQIQWVKNEGDYDNDYGSEIHTDNNGNVYTTAVFIGTIDGNPGADEVLLTSGGVGFALMVQKLAPDGSFIWAGASVALDQTLGQARVVGDIYYCIGGYSGTGDFDPQSTEFIMSSVGLHDVYVMKWNTGTAGIESTVAQNDFIVYPNPGRGEFVVKGSVLSTGTEITIYNLLGEIVLAGKSNGAPLRFTINGPAGYYVMQCRSTQGNVYVIPVVKE